MKKFKFLPLLMMGLVASSATLVSCSNDEIDGGGTVNNGKSNDLYLGYSVIHENAGTTRGTATTLANFEVADNTFMVVGFYATDATGDGVTPGAQYVGSSATEGTVIKYTGSAWDYNSEADKKLWPKTTAPLNFQAVSPASAGTIINTPADNVAKLGMTITVPNDNAEQKDVIFGHAEGVTYETSGAVASLAFEHALSQVLFQAKVATDDLTAIVKGVKVCNVKNKADIGYLGALTGDRRALAVENIAATTDKFAVGMVGADDVTVTSTTATDLCATDGVLLMIPQSGGTAWDVAEDTPTAPTIADADAAGQTYIEVECKIFYTASGEYVSGSSTEYAKIYLPFNVDWAIGKKYTYVLNFGSGSGGYNEEGEKELNYISYSVASVSDWGVVSTDDIEL